MSRTDGGPVKSGCYYEKESGEIFIKNISGVITTKHRYFLDSDNSGHWYIIPCESEEAWSEWLDIPGDDERSWDVPEFAKQVNGPSSITFTDFEER